jgi:indolepyruvate ferredoxin oxidoreductase beta subunit
LAKPELCTGCRVCEWLCPDFAIDVIKANSSMVHQ